MSASTSKQGGSEGAPPGPEDPSWATLLQAYAAAGKGNPLLPGMPLLPMGAFAQVGPGGAATLAASHDPRTALTTPPPPPAALHVPRPALLRRYARSPPLRRDDGGQADHRQRQPGGRGQAQGRALHTPGPAGLRRRLCPVAARAPPAGGGGGACSGGLQRGPAARGRPARRRSANLQRLRWKRRAFAIANYVVCLPAAQSTSSDEEGGGEPEVSAAPRRSRSESRPPSQLGRPPSGPGRPPSRATAGGAGAKRKAPGEGLGVKSQSDAALSLLASAAANKPGQGDGGPSPAAAAAAAAAAQGVVGELWGALGGPPVAVSPPDLSRMASDAQMQQLLVGAGAAGGARGAPRVRSSRPAAPRSSTFREVSGALQRLRPGPSTRRSTVPASRALSFNPSARPPARPQASGTLDEREAKRLRRKQSNRESARRSRLRKQAECEALARQVKELIQGGWAGGWRAGAGRNEWAAAGQGCMRAAAPRVTSGLCC